MNNDVQIANIVPGSPSPESTKYRNRIAVFEHNRSISIKRRAENAGLATFSADGEREAGINGERVATEGKLRGQRPEVGERAIDFWDGT